MTVPTICKITCAVSIIILIVIPHPLERCFT